MKQVERDLEQADKEEFLEWKRNPVTALLFRWVQAKRDTLKDEVIGGSVAAPTFEETAIRMAAAQGYASALNDIIGIEYVDLTGVDRE
jgi:hypothetical protein